MNATEADAAWLRLREQALLLVDGRGELLDAAREISRAMIAAGLEVAVIGGIAVVLHGHARATKDIDVFVRGPLEPVAQSLAEIGFLHDPARREFVRADMPVRLVDARRLGVHPGPAVEIEGVTTVSFVDLMAMKLRSGTESLLRAQDLADVIGLARRHGLGGAFAAKLPKDVRPAFRRIIRALASEPLSSD